jgi:hypothetical protein
MRYVFRSIGQCVVSPEARRWRMAQVRERWAQGGWRAVVAAVARRFERRPRA